MNKNSILVFFGCVMLSLPIFAEKYGGRLIKKGSYLGKIAFVDTQKSLAFTNVQQVAGQLAEATQMNVIALRHIPESPDNLKKELGVEVLVALVDDPSSPVMLIAPEDHWGQVNVAKLVDDLPGERAKAKFRDSRARKELIRAFSLMCGGGGSQFRGNMMNAATLKEVDRSYDTIPVDMVDFYQTHLKHYGVTPKVIVTYEMACEEGWAPLPTNDVQKVIWDAIHKVPDQPMKIEFKKKK